MSSPAERYAAAKRRAKTPQVSDFEAGYDFPLDEFQLAACRALEAGEGVLVAAPTGAGKTVVGEFAVHLALAQGQKCFYTTPIKALSNQKYADLVARHGAGSVGLLTGDNAVNGHAPVVVMTTEVLRNMLYAGSPALRGLGYVVMDEVHYLADRFRGAVWEEVIIHLPASIRLVSLSATVSNAEEFADWLVTVRGDTRVIVEEHRPVPLWQHILAGSRLYDLFAQGPDARLAVNPDLVRLAREDARFAPQRGYGRTRPGRPDPRTPGRAYAPSRVEVVERLDADGLLPAITFVFSRVGCEAAVAQCLRGGLRLNTAEEREAVRAYVEKRTGEIPDADLRVLGYWEWLEGLERGIAAHHAGMLPTFKEVVEELFVRGLVKAVFATETLALGINMPARSVVLEKLTKWNGETHADVTPGEYTQLTGRAGRRGIDVEGHAVVLWQPGLDPGSVAGLASTRTYPLRSSFSPSYNMAVNIVGSLGRERARAVLESSFAQFQADRSVVGLGRQVARNLEALEGYRAAMTCHLGDFEAYAALRRALSARESALAREGSASRRAAAAESLERLRAGDVIRVPSGRRSGLAVVLDPGVDRSGDAHPLVLTEDRWAGRLSTTDFPTPVESLATVRVPRNFNHRSPQARRDLASSLRVSGAEAGSAGRPRRARSSAADDPELARLRAAVRGHPCQGCDAREDHARWSERYERLRRDTDALERRVETKTNTIARTFDRVCSLLTERGYLAGEEATAAGAMLARVYSESDLLVVECLRAGLWDELTPAELAACVSSVVYEARRPDDQVAPRVPGGRVRDTLAEMVRLWARLEEAETGHRLSFLRAPDPGFAWAAFRWASGQSLDSVLSDAGPGGEPMTAGDFVRWTKQLLDLLSQLSLVAAEGSPVRASASAAVGALRRGVVAYTSVG
ncbi:MAG: DEAD/DEAH box helicase [Actinomycetota bacterium]|nr:DEAD/DEAH box helicase [Actinomycetota bacterium]